MRPYVLQAGEGWTYRHDIDFTVKAGELDPGRGATFTEYATRKGEEPSLHSHPTEDEMFYVLSGDLTFYCGDASFNVGAGGFVYLPRGHKHGYTIRSGGPVRLIVVTFPVREEAGEGWEGFIADLEREARLVAEPETPTG